MICTNAAAYSSATDTTNGVLKSSYNVCVFVSFYPPATSLAVQAAAAATQKALLKDGKDKGLSAKDLRQLRRNGPPIIRKPKSGRNEEEGASSGHSDSNHFPHHSNAIARSSSSGSGSSWESKDNVSSGGREKKRKAPEGSKEEKGIEAAAVSTGMFHNDSRSSTSIRDIDRSMQGESNPFSRTAPSSSASASASKKQRQRR